MTAGGTIRNFVSEAVFRHWQTNLSPNVTLSRWVGVVLSRGVGDAVTAVWVTPSRCLGWQRRVELVLNHRINDHRRRHGRHKDRQRRP